MSNQIINIHVPVAIEARKYFDYLRLNFLHTAHDPDRLFFFVYALDEQVQAAYQNDPDISASYPVYEMKGAYRLRTWLDWKVFLRAKLTGKASLHGSNGHAAGLNRMMQAFPTMAGHHVIADSDVAMLIKDWDQIVEDLWEEFHLIGTNYEDIGGFSSGSGKVQTYKQFPNPIWLGIRQDCSLSEVDWMPAKEMNIKIDTEELSQLYNLPIGYELVRDVGWRLPSYCQARDFNFTVLQQVKPKSGLTQVLKTEQDYNEEYQLNGAAFVGHQRGGSRHEFKGCDISTRFYDCVEKAVGIPIGT
jgi:hypothetical protein